jgi:alkylhydroperoxidase family enzyme
MPLAALTTARDDRKLAPTAGVARAARASGAASKRKRIAMADTSQITIDHPDQMTGS